MHKTAIADDDFDATAVLAAWTADLRIELATRLSRDFHLSTRLVHRKDAS